jgi:hypothetical protein
MSTSGILVWRPVNLCEPIDCGLPRLWHRGDSEEMLLVLVADTLEFKMGTTPASQIPTLSACAFQQSSLPLGMSGPQFRMPSV